MQTADLKSSRCLLLELAALGSPLPGHYQPLSPSAHQTQAAKGRSSTHVNRTICCERGTIQAAQYGYCTCSRMQQGEKVTHLRTHGFRQKWHATYAVITQVSERRMRDHTDKFDAALTALSASATREQRMRGRREPIAVALPHLPWQCCDRRRRIMAANLHDHMCIASLHTHRSALQPSAGIKIVTGLPSAPGVMEPFCQRQTSVDPITRVIDTACTECRNMQKSDLECKAANAGHEPPLIARARMAGSSLGRHSPGCC